MNKQTEMFIKKHGYTHDELKNNQKSFRANFVGSALNSFASKGMVAGVTRTPFGKGRVLLTPKFTKLGVATLISGSALKYGASTYYDIKSFSASKKKGRNILDAVVRGVIGNFAGSIVGSGTASITKAGLRSLKKQSSKFANSETVRFYKAKPVNEAAKLPNMAKKKLGDIIGFRRFRGRVVPIRAKTVRQGPALLQAPKG